MTSLLSRSPLLLRGRILPQRAAAAGLRSRRPVPPWCGCASAWTCRCSWPHGRGWASSSASGALGSPGWKRAGAQRGAHGLAPRDPENLLRRTPPRTITTFSAPQPRAGGRTARSLAHKLAAAVYLRSAPTPTMTRRGASRLALTRQLLQLGASRWVEENRTRPVTHEWRCAAIQTDAAGRRLRRQQRICWQQCRSPRREKRGISDISL
jgi:hypothetical protein